MALWVLTLSPDHMRRLTPEEGAAQMPAWPPDGQTIAYYYSADQTGTSNTSPSVINAHGNSAPRPAASSTRDFTSLRFVIDELHTIFLGRPLWFPDSQSLLITVQERGQAHLSTLDLEHDQPAQFTS